jgi:cytosine/adenosine deaminase-related metal-dependent hydrolase
MHFVATHYPGASPAQILDMATLNGARALGRDHWFGALRPGRKSAMIYLPLSASRPESVLEQMVHGEDR